MPQMSSAMDQSNRPPMIGHFLKNRALPSGYFSMLIVVLSLSYIVSPRRVQSSATNFKIDWAMFFLGVGFMMLETKVMARLHYWSVLRGLSIVLSLVRSC